MMYGFGAMMLIKGIDWIAKRAVKRAFPITHVLALGFDGVMAGYMRAAVVLIIADSAYQVKEFLHQRANRQQQEDFYYCSVEGGCFTGISELRAANSSYKIAKWMLVGRFAMDAVLMYLPMARGVLTRMGDKVILEEFAADAEAFKALGLPAGDFARVESAMRIGTLMREKRPLDDIVVRAAKNPDEKLYIEVRDGTLPSLGKESPQLFTKGVNGWVSVNDVSSIARLAPKFDGAIDVSAIAKLDADFAVKAYEDIGSLSTAEGWSDFERSYSRLAAKMKASQDYRLPSVYDCMAAEDAFRALDLNPKKLKSWGKVEDARALQLRATTDPAVVRKINLAADFLKKYRAMDPNVVTEGLPEVSRAERKLVATLQRSPAIEEYWSLFELIHDGFDSKLVVKVLKPRVLK
jgi:hypothetical protein